MTSEPTPRVDAAILREAISHAGQITFVVKADFARQLERELSAAVRERDEALERERTGEWKHRYEEEYAIVARVWKALGIETYEQAQPYTIDEHVHRLRASLERANKTIAQLNARLHCMCGSPVDEHGMGDGHGPVSMYDYSLEKAEEALERRDELARELAEAVTGNWMEHCTDGFCCEHCHIRFAEAKEWLTIAHEPDCIVTKARALLSDTQEGGKHGG